MFSPMATGEKNQEADAKPELRELLTNEIDRRDITRRAAAEKLGVSPQMLSSWLQGVVPKSTQERVTRLATFLHLSHHELKEMLRRERHTRESNARKIERLGQEFVALREELERLFDLVNRIQLTQQKSLERVTRFLNEHGIPIDLSEEGV
jgi:transcriptional regulator with XRE-family HTH domain